MLTDKTLIYALFNKSSRAFSAWITDISGIPENVRANMLLKEVILEEHGIIDGMFNPDRFQWHGDYDTGKFVDLLGENKAIVTEEEVNNKYDSIFFRKYDVKNILYQLIENATMQTQEGKDMQTFLSKMLTRKNNDIEYYKTSGLHIYEIIEDQKKREHDAFKT